MKDVVKILKEMKEELEYLIVAAPGDVELRKKRIDALDEAIMKFKIKKYYFMNDKIYYHGEQQPPRKTELFFVSKVGNSYLGKDELGNDYVIREENIIIEEGEVDC